MIGGPDFGNVGLSLNVGSVAFDVVVELALLDLLLNQVLGDAGDEAFDKEPSDDDYRKDDDDADHDSTGGRHFGRVVRCFELGKCVRARN